MNFCPQGHTLFQSFGVIPGCYSCAKYYQIDRGFKCDLCHYYVCDQCHNFGPNNVNVQSNLGFGQVGIQGGIGIQGQAGFQTQQQIPQKIVTTTTTTTHLVGHKFCPKNHILSFGTPLVRANCVCNTCGQGPLQGTWYCKPCDWDLCFNCYDKGCSVPTSRVKLCKNYHMLILSDSKTRANVTCDVCKFFVTEGRQYTCYGCNYDMCLKCYGGYQNTQEVTVYFSKHEQQTIGIGGNITTQTQQVGYQTGLNQQTGFGQQSGYQQGGFQQQTGFQQGGYGQTGFQGQQGGFQQQTGFQQGGFGQTGFQGQQGGFQQQTGFQQGGYGQTGFQGQQTGFQTGGYQQQVGFQGQQGFQQGGFQGQVGIQSNVTNISPQKIVTTTTTTTHLVDHKRCPSGHYLSYGTSRIRANCRCDTCGTQPLQQTWFCKACDWDLCFNCYDKGCSVPSAKVKVCRNYHMLIYTTSRTRANVTCDVCHWAVQDGRQYTCYGCDYDMCMNCYTGHQNPNDCNIF